MAENFVFKQTGAELQAIIDAVETIDQTPTAGSKNPVESGGVAAALEGVETELQGVDDALEGVDGRLDGVDARLDDADTALAGKQATLVSGTNIKTVNGQSILGAGDLRVGDENAVQNLAGSGSAYTTVIKAGNDDSMTAEVRMVDGSVKAQAAGGSVEVNASGVALQAGNSGAPNAKVTYNGNEVATKANITTALATIEAVIPAQASAQNQLADKAFVNSSISSSTANFVGTFNSLAELQAVTGATNNDYGFVIETDSVGNEYYDRYKYNGSSWLFEYKVESTPFTAAQWAAIQSGITSALVSKLSALPTNSELTTSLNEKADKSDTYTKQEVNDAIAAIDVSSQISGKADKVANAVSGDLAGLDANGNLTDSGSKASDFATAAQGAKADSALQRTDMATVNGSDITHGGNVTIVAAEGQTITIDAAPTEGSNNAVSSGGVFDAFFEGKATANLFDKTAITDGYVNSTTGALGGTTSPSYKVSALIPVTGGRYYHLSGRSEAAGLFSLRCLDENNNILKPLVASTGAEASSYSLFNNEGTYTAYNGQFKTPSNAAYVQFNVVFNNSGSADGIMLLDIGETYNPSYTPPPYIPHTVAVLKDSLIEDSPIILGIEESISDVNARVDSVEEDLSDMVEQRVSPNLFDKSECPADNKVITTSGSLANIPSWTLNVHTGLIPIEPNKYYYISGWNLLQAKNIRCVKADGTTIMKALDPSTGEPYADSYLFPASWNNQFKTPSDAAYVQFNIATQDIDARSTAMLELVGDAYNPNFTPSPYEPYYNYTAIKNSYLPSISGLEEKINVVEARQYPLKVLLIGSSHGMNTIAQFPWMAYRSGFDVTVGNVYIGSLSMQRLVGIARRGETMNLKVFRGGVWKTETGKTLADVLSYTEWDYISLQRSASDDTIWLSTQKEADTEQNVITDVNYGVSGATPEYMSHSEALQILLDYVRECSSNAPTIIFNTGFADADNTGTSDILSSTEKMREEFGIEYYSTAAALANARSTFLRLYGTSSLHNLAYDSQHLDYGIGCWVVSAVLFESIYRRFGRSIQSLPDDAFGSQEEIASFFAGASSTNYTTPTPELMTVAKACAMVAVDHPDEVSTAIGNRFKWSISYALSNGATLSNKKFYAAQNDTYKSAITSSGSPSVSVVMGGVDITSSCYDSATKTIEIASVSGDVRITIS